MSEPEYTVPFSKAPDSNKDGLRIEYGYKSLHPGDIVGGRYQIIKELRSGGFATTYLARDLSSESDDKCVVKKLQPRFNSPKIWQNAKERFTTEGTVLQWLGKHEQIPKLLAHFEEERQFYLVQEFIEGEEFEQEVSRREFLSESEVIHFLYDVLQVIDFVHKQGVIHRDIKPSNLIRRNSDRKMVLIDFGAVKEISTMSFDSQKQTIETQIIGTPGYMSPEQNNGKPVYSSDIYALGRTAVFALTGRSPVELEDTQAGEALTWQNFTKVSSKFASILNKMMSSRTSERYTCATEVLSALQPLLRIGKIVKDRYKIISYLGGREESRTYLVRNIAEREETDYVLKIIKLPHYPKASILQVKNNLDQALAAFKKLENCDRAAHLIECFQEEEELYLLEDYVEGKDLEQQLKKYKSLSEEKILELLEGALEALVYIHKQQLVHGNIKPSNLIFRQSDLKVVLTDFAAITDIIDGFPEIEKGYIPPEQIAGNMYFASDIYALGITAITAWTGITPDRLQKNPATGEIIWPEKVEINQRLAKVLEKMVRLDLKKRYHSASEVLGALKKTKRRSVLILTEPWLLYPLSLGTLGLVGFFGNFFWMQYQASVLFEKADIRLESQQYERAVAYYDGGIDLLGGRVKNVERPWLAKATALSHLKRYQDMLATCDRPLLVERNSPFRIHFLNCKGLAFDGLKEYDRAIAVFDRAIKLSPGFIDAWNNRGESNLKANRIENAIADFQKAITLDPSRSFVPLNNLGKLFLRQKQYDKALEYYERAIKVRSNYLPALIGKGHAQRAMQQYSKAIVSYQRAINLHPTSFEAWYSKGLTQEILQDYSEAIDSYRRAVEINPKFQVALDALKRLEEK
jgi:serine/threonine protein kinase/Flp pilus assembly protein TadD